ncbi:MAG: DUF2149 domain-containing protein [Crocinitomicaceae bacterium]|nr:DUF2149 domain-containing protein [Crocinitomicaceae bacterium]
MLDNWNGRSKLLRFGKSGLRDFDFDEDPLSGVANLVDLMIVFSVGLMLSITTYYGLPELLSPEDVTLVKNPGHPNMEVIQRKGQKIEKYKMTNEQGSGEGELMGTMYKIKGGEIIYVPESSDKK